MRKSTSIKSVDPRLLWREDDDPAQYVLVDYYIETPFDLESAAIFMAEEQSLPVDIASRIPVAFCTDERIAKVVDIQSAGESTDRILPTYWLGEFSEDQERCLAGERFNCGTVRIAFPAAGFGDNLTHLWSVVYGELPRHGTLSAFKIMDIVFPESILAAFPGPRFGVAGLRDLLGVPERPLFARSTQPPVGLTTESMIAISTEVLGGGFDFIKDDELTLDDPLSPFEHRVPALVKHVREMSRQTGARKGYFANIIDSPVRSLERLDFALEAGVDGVVAATGMQGIEFLRDIRARCPVPILAHNAGIDMQTRHPKVGVDYSLSIKLDRLCGGDMAMLPGPALTRGSDPDEVKRCIDACLAPLGSHKPILPILAGGKKADELGAYCEALGTNDFVLIIATDVDDHPDGQRAGASRFQAAWDQHAG